MTEMSGNCREVFDKAEWIAIVSWSAEGPHLVGAWGDDLREIGIEDNETLILPAGKYFKTEENLRRNSSVQLMVVAKDVRGTRGMGQGYRIYGKGMIQCKGEMAEKAKAKFPRSRGAFVIKVEKAEALL